MPEIFVLATVVANTEKEGSPLPTPVRVGKHSRHFCNGKEEYTPRQVKGERRRRGGDTHSCPPSPVAHPSVTHALCSAFSSEIQRQVPYNKGATRRRIAFVQEGTCRSINKSGTSLAPSQSVSAKQRSVPRPLPKQANSCHN